MMFPEFVSAELLPSKSNTEPESEVRVVSFSCVVLVSFVRMQYWPGHSFDTQQIDLV
jgi:hypothetical protein